MDLKQAREIARSVGATISEDVPDVNEGKVYKVRLGLIRMGANGVREDIILQARTPTEAADLACVETGRAARELLELAKRVYADSDLIFGAKK